MNTSLFHEAFTHFISEKYPFTHTHPVENTTNLRSWGLNPKIYRKLPRHTLNKENAIEEISPLFRDTKQLKKMLIDSAILSLYPSTPSPKTVILFTWVYWDGWGDYYAQLDCARLIEEKFPELKLLLVSCLHASKQPPEIHPNQYIVPFEKGKKPVFSKALIKTMQQAHLLFQFPTYYPYTQDLINTLGPHLHYEFLGESGFIETPDYLPGSGRRCMGLHFLEKGLFIKSLPQKHPARPYYFAYTRTLEGLTHYVQALMHWKQANMHIYTFNITHVIQMVQQKLIQAKCVKISVDGTLTSIPLQQGDITIHFHLFHNLSHQQFLSLLQESQDFVACTGDGSLFEAIAADKIFYYDTPDHKKKFREDLLALTKARTPDALPFFENPKNIIYPKVRDSLKKLNQIIRTEHNVNELLCHLLQRSLCHQNHPKLKQIEAKILEDFAEGHLTAPQALETLKNQVHHVINEA